MEKRDRLAQTKPEKVGFLIGGLKLKLFLINEIPAFAGIKSKLKNSSKSQYA